MKRFVCAIAILMLLLNLAMAQSTRPDNKPSSRNLQPAAATTVTGSGTFGRLSKWVGASGPSTFVLGDSNITEDKFGKVGIGTATPTSPLTVQGMIETQLGGYKFPDGTIQNSAFSGVAHDLTLKGDGTAGQPLGVAVPLIFAGDVSDGNGVITITNIAAGGPGLFAVGGDSSPVIGGGSGVLALGGSGTNAPGGVGLIGFGGNANNATGGTGASLIGGVATNGGNGGDGAFAVGALGTGAGKKGGRGIVAIAGGGASGATAGLAGDFVGDVNVSGNLSKGGGSFKIDHPLDPENKYLYHSFVESPDMMNIYNGNIITDANSEAIVTLPGYFEALNRDFRYQLTVIGQFAQAIVIEKIKGNHFRIKTNAPNVEVSWQVTGVRQDAYANKHRIPVEEAKPEAERGSYLHPDAFNQPEEKNVLVVEHPELLRQMKEPRGQMTQKMPGNHP